MFIALLVVVILLFFVLANANKYPKAPPHYRELGSEQLVLDLLLNKYDMSFGYINEVAQENAK